MSVSTLKMQFVSGKLIVYPTSIETGWQGWRQAPLGASKPWQTFTAVAEVRMERIVAMVLGAESCILVVWWGLLERGVLRVWFEDLCRIEAAAGSSFMAGASNAFILFLHVFLYADPNF